MNDGLLAAIVTSVATAAATAGTAITALIVQGRRTDGIEKRLEKVETALEMLIGSLHDVDKRLSVLEDRISR